VTCSAYGTDMTDRKAGIYCSIYFPVFATATIYVVTATIIVKEQ